MIGYVYWDGGARPKNPGHAGFAVLVETDEGERVISRYLGIHTNNYAEYTGLIVGIKMAADLGCDEIVMTGDSKLVIEQVSGNWRCNKEDLRELCYRAQGLLHKHFHDAWEFKHVRGHQGHPQNERVDELCTDAIKHGMSTLRSTNPWLKKLGQEVKIEGRQIFSEEGTFVR